MSLSPRNLLVGIGVLLSLFLSVAPAYAAMPGLELLSPRNWFGIGSNSVQQSSTTLKLNLPTNFLPKIANQVNAQTAQAKSNKVVMGWLTPWGDDSFNSFKSNLDTITEVHPFVYTIGADGVSVVPDQGDWHQAEVMTLSKQHDIKVIPTISGDVNSSDLMLNDHAKEAAHVDAIMQTIHTNGYDGWDVDYEGFMNGYNRAVYAQFIKDLAARLHAENKTLSISIEAFNTQQDWDTIGQNVDHFIIMGYDYHSATGPQVGPIGPADWLKTVIDYAQTRVSKSKIVLGLGTYGYSWAFNGYQYTSTAVNYSDAMAIAQDTGATIQRDDQAPYFNYNRGYGQRSLYYEDELSTKPKLQLVNDSGIGGVGFWRLGSEDPSIWKDVSNILAN